MEILDIKNLSFSYAGCEEKALDGVSFTVNEGEFVALCGETGSGKSTLLKLLKRELRPNGKLEGAVLLGGEDISSFTPARSAREVGFVMQHPEQQIVCDKVWHELAFGLENLRVPEQEIRRRVAETACYFGLDGIFKQNVSSLSGGQKQLLNLASVCVMQPRVLVLDEPTSQLDPIAASQFIATVRRMNRELSMTVIICEHRLEEVLPLADKALVLKNGKAAFYGPAREAAARFAADEKCDMPAASRVFARTGGKGECPVDALEGKKYVTQNFSNRVRSLGREEKERSSGPALEFSHVFFRYEKNAPDALFDLELKAYPGEHTCILGGNGSGKTTALCAAAGLRRIYDGKIKILGKNIDTYRNGALYRNCVAMLPQDVQTAFLRMTVREELKDSGCAPENLPFDVSHLLERHPYDLSGGEMQLVALAKALATKPKILLLDEPTKGLDSGFKQILKRIIKELCDSGAAVVTVTHDVEFAAESADMCVMLFGGSAAACSGPREFFGGNAYYTTTCARMTRGYFENAVTADDVCALCEANGRKEAGV